MLQVEKESNMNKALKPKCSLTNSTNEVVFCMRYDDGILQQDLDSIYQLIFDYNVESMANYDTHVNSDIEMLMIQKMKDKAISRVV